MIGLKRGTVMLFPHDEAWKNEAELTIKCLRNVLGSAALDIRHVGSTSIAGICAKPIIDIAVCVREFDDLLPHLCALEEAGFIHRPNVDSEHQMFFVCGDFENDTRTHHIHAVKEDSTEWRDYNNFRDYMNSHPNDAAKYDALKKELCSKYADDRETYTASKAAFIKRILDRALAWSMLGREVDIVIDRPIGFVHPKHPDMVYPVNYGYVRNVMGGDGEELDAYLLGVEVPVRGFAGRVVGVIYREDDDEDKLVVLPIGMSMSKDKIKKLTEFTEKYFDSRYEVIN